MAGPVRLGLAAVLGPVKRVNGGSGSAMFHRVVVVTSTDRWPLGAAATGNQGRRQFATDDSSGKDGATAESSSKGEKKPLRVKVAYPRIYTRTGDKGMSSLFTGERRKKSDDVFEALGTTDELSSHIGVAREMALLAEGDHPGERTAYADQLQRVQCLLQDVGAFLATPKNSADPDGVDRASKASKELRSQRFSRRHVDELEEWIDELSSRLPPLDNFILPGGGVTSATLHVARGVCRRAERRIVPLVDSGHVEPEVLKYVNRLSDYLFTVARYAAMLDRKAETIYTRTPPDLEEGSTYRSVDGVWKKNTTRS